MNDMLPISSTSIHWSVAMPIIIVAIAGLVAMMMDAFARDITAVEWVAGLGLTLAIVVCVTGTFPIEPSFAAAAKPGEGQLVADGFGILLDVLLCSMGLLTIFMSRSYLDRQRLVHGEYYVLLLFCIAGMMLMVQATELITMFVALEILSVSLYVLSAFARNRRRSSEAGLKYLLLGAFSSAFFLFGITFLYGATGGTSLAGIHRAVLAATATDASAAQTLFTQVTLAAGVGLIIVGLGFKVAAVPFHVWAPDVYEGAPTPITAFMSVATKAAAFGALARILFTAFAPMESLWGPLVVVLSVSTMVLGNVAAIRQTNIKRMLAYSSVAHAGYVLVGFVGVSAWGVGDTSGILYYLLAYAAMNFGAFAAVAYLTRRNQEYTEIVHFNGLARRQPMVAIAMSFFMFSLAGVPPFVGFYAKWVLFVNAVERGQTTLVVIAFLASVVSAYYYLRVVVNMWMLPSEPHVRPMALAPGSGFVIGLCAVFVLLTGLAVNPLVDAAERGTMFSEGVATFEEPPIGLPPWDPGQAPALPLEPTP